MRAAHFVNAKSILRYSSDHCRSSQTAGSRSWYLDIYIYMDVR